LECLDPHPDASDMTSAKRTNNILFINFMTSSAVEAGSLTAMRPPETCRRTVENPAGSYSPESKIVQPAAPSEAD
jgi:hypothetical protein